MIILVLAGLGLVLGSFVNALVWRIYEQEQLATKNRPSKADKIRLEQLSIVKGRSMCLSCGHELSAKDLIPVLSWLSLRGKCRYCGARIPDTPVAELLVPVLLIVSYLWWPWTLVGVLAWAQFAVWVLCIVAFVALLLYDMRWYLLPNRIVFPVIGLAVAFRGLLAVQSGVNWADVLLAGFWGVLLLAGLFYILFIVSNEQWIGGGDVKLAVALGLLAGGPLAALLLLFFASVGGSVAAVPLLLRGKSVKGLRVPFGPFLILATVVTVLFSQPILSWYMGFFTY